MLNPETYVSNTNILPREAQGTSNTVRRDASNAIRLRTGNVRPWQLELGAGGGTLVHITLRHRLGHDRWFGGLGAGGDLQTIQIEGRDFEVRLLTIFGELSWRFLSTPGFALILRARGTWNRLSSEDLSADAWGATPSCVMEAGPFALSFDHPILFRRGVLWNPQFGGALVLAF